MSHVVFNINAKTLFGDVLFITGNCRALGDWDLSRSVALRTDDQSFPNWSTTVFLENPGRIEYKYFVRNGNGKVQWEKFEQNRELITNSIWLIVDDGKFGMMKEERREITSTNYENYSSVMGVPFLTNAEEQQKIKEYQEALEVQANMIADLNSKVGFLQKQVSILEGDQLHSLSIEQLQVLSIKCRKVADQSSELMLKKIQEKCQTPRTSECVTCMDRAIDTIIFPCAHLVVCHDCSFRLGGKCPICKQKIETLHKVYMK